MAPIHESDVDERRFQSSEWNTYEFWERVEARLLWKRRLWFLLSILAFLSIAAVPVIREGGPKWRAMVLRRHLAAEINRIKRDVASEGVAYTLVFSAPSLIYKIYKSEKCNSKQIEYVRSGSIDASNQQELALLSPELGHKMGFVTLVDRFCYDPLLGSEEASQGKDHTGFGILPAKDLTENRVDRLVFLVLSGPSAQISFE